MYLFKFITKQFSAFMNLIKGIKFYNNEISFLCQEKSFKIIEEKDDTCFFITLYDDNKKHEYYFSNCEYKIFLNLDDLINILKSEKNPKYLEIFIQSECNKLFIYTNKNKNVLKNIDIVFKDFNMIQKNPVYFNKKISINNSDFLNAINYLKFYKKKVNTDIFIKTTSNYINFSNNSGNNIYLTDTNLEEFNDNEMYIKLNFNNFYNLIKKYSKLSLFTVLYVKENLLVLVFDGIFRIITHTSIN